VKRTN